MKVRFVSYGVVVVALAGVLSLLLVSMPAAQQDAVRTFSADEWVTAADTDRPTPLLANGRPDFSGFYGGKYGTETGGPLSSTTAKAPDGSIYFQYAGANVGASLPALSQADNQPPYNPEYMAKVQAIADAMYGGNSLDDPALVCKPHGVVRAGIRGLLVHSPEMLAILYEASPGPYWRVIYTDGRAHPEEPDTSYFGHSIGRWEGDTLVVDTVALNDETWLGGRQDGAIKLTSIHSDQMHLIERISRKGDMLTHQITVEDPIMFSRPWVMESRTLQANRTGDYIQPQMCVDVTSAHMIRPTPEDPDLKCGWCVSQSEYGLDSDLPTAIDRQDHYQKLKEQGYAGVRQSADAPGE
jgi:hypothetical protein